MNGAALQGDISSVELNSIFQFLDYATLSGELTVFTEGNSGSFFFHNGMLIFGTLSTNQKQIGHLLIESGFITRKQLNHCLRLHLQQGMRERLGGILVKNGCLDFKNLSETLKRQAKEAFFEILSWKKGMFFFYKNQHPPEEEILLNERIDHFIFEQIVRMDESRY